MPPTRLSVADAAAILGVEADADEAARKTAYKRLALQHHPDKGGDAETFKKVGAAMERLEQHSAAQSRSSGGHPFHHAHGHPFHGHYEDYYDDDDEDEDEDYYYDDEDEYYDEDDEGARFYDFFDFMFGGGGGGPFPGFFPGHFGGFPGRGQYDYDEMQRMSEEKRQYQREKERERQKEREAESKAKQDAVSSIVKERETLLSLSPSLGCRTCTSTSLELFILVQGKPLVLTCKPSIEGQEPTQVKLSPGTLFEVQVYHTVSHPADPSIKGGGSSKGKKKGSKGSKEGHRGGSGSGWVSLPLGKDPSRIAVPNLTPATEYRVRARLGLSAECSILSEQEWEPFGDEFLATTKVGEMPAPPPQTPQEKKTAPVPPKTPHIEPKAAPPPPPSPSPPPDEENFWLEDLGGSYKCTLCGTVLKSWDAVEKHEMTSKHQKKANQAGIKTSSFNFNEFM